MSFPFFLSCWAELLDSSESIDNSENLSFFVLWEELLCFHLCGQVHHLQYICVHICTYIDLYVINVIFNIFYSMYACVYILIYILKYIGVRWTTKTTGNQFLPPPRSYLKPFNVFSTIPCAILLKSLSLSLVSNLLS